MLDVFFRRHVTTTTSTSINMASSSVKHLKPSVKRTFSGPVKGVLLDITGVLYESGTGKPIDGSVAAINKLRKLQIPFRFITNETTCTLTNLVEKLQSYGFTINRHEVVAPAPAVVNMLNERNLRPYLLVHPEIRSEFDSCNQNDPNCVVVGDAAEHFTYKNLNQAFQVLMGLKEPILISMGKGKYYKHKNHLSLDLGCYTTALEYAVGINAIIMGKPAQQYFLRTVQDMGIRPEHAVMVGDDIENDVGAAQICGLQGVLLKTGKFRPEDLQRSCVVPHAVYDNLSTFIDALAKCNKAVKEKETI